jgi:benzoyl-CoA reductase subunit C
VVIEDNCLGNRYFWDEVSPDGDLLSAVAARYLEKPPCPQRDIGPRVRASYLTGLAKEYDVQGVVFLRQKFCDPHAYEVPVLQQAFRDQGLPTLILELDVTTPYGQYRTRIEAFMEMFL